MYLTTIVLFAGSWLLHRGISCIKKDDIKNLRRYLGSSVATGILFIFLQYEGFRQIHINSPGQVKIILVIVSAHCICFSGKVVNLFLLWKPLFSLKTKADTYIYFLDNKKNTAFRSARTYQEFLSIVWTIIYIIITIKTAW